MTEAAAQKTAEVEIDDNFIDFKITVPVITDEVVQHYLALNKDLPNDARISFCTYDEAKKQMHGPVLVMAKNADGFLKDAEGSHVDDKLHGQWTDYYAHGQIANTFHYEDGLLNGAAVGFYENGNISFSCDYKNDELEGAHKLYYPAALVENAEAGGLHEVQTYVAGVMHGPFKRYFKDGSLDAEANLQNGVLHGECTEYYAPAETPDGAAKRVKKNVNYTDGQYNGMCTHNYPDGKMAHCSGYKMGVLHGKYQDNYATSELTPGTINHLKLLANYQDGALSGQYYKYYSNGQLQENSTFENDLYQGESATYRRDGNPAYIAQYKDSKLNGAAKLYSEKNRLLNIKNYKDDRLNGVSTCYGADGKATSQIYYEDNKQIIEKTYAEGSFYMIRFADNAALTKQANRALWWLQMGDNLRHFIGDDRSVEKINEDQVHALKGKLTAKVAALIPA